MTGGRNEDKQESEGSEAESGQESETVEVEEDPIFEEVGVVVYQSGKLLPFI